MSLPVLLAWMVYSSKFGGCLSPSMPSNTLGLATIPILPEARDKGVNNLP